MSQSRIQEEAAIQVQAMTMQTVKEAGEELTRLMEAAQIMTDPARGNYLDILM